MISKHHGAVFVHIPKCGGQSVEQMFLEDLGLDWDNRAPLVLRPNTDPAKGPPRLAHLLARDYVRLGYLTAEDFAAFHKFTIVRDPYKRALSVFNYLSLSAPRSKPLQAVLGTRITKRLLGADPMGLDEVMLDWLPAQFAAGDGDGHTSMFWFIRPQVDYAFDADGAFLVDEVIKLEELNDKVEGLRSRYGLTPPLRHVNKSTATAKTQDFQPQHLDMIERLYAADFEAFGYAKRAR